MEPDNGGNGSIDKRGERERGGAHERTPRGGVGVHEELCLQQVRSGGGGAVA